MGMSWRTIACTAGLVVLLGGASASGGTSASPVSAATAGAAGSSASAAAGALAYDSALESGGSLASDGALAFVGSLASAGAFASAGSLASAGSAAPAPLAPAAPPPAPVWPVPDLRADVLDLLRFYYAQRADPGVVDYNRRAPTGEAHKRTAWKDPDTLWEYFGGPGTACHAAAADIDFIDCTGRRVYRAVASANKPPYAGGLSLFNPGLGYYGNEAYASLAGYFALYHAFALAFDAPDDFSPYPAAGARENKVYHRRMMKAYEAHMRNIIVKVFIDPAAKGDPGFQASATRSLGLLASLYAHVAQAMEEYGGWAKASGDRRYAVATLNGLNQRLFWEWVWPQRNGPRTAGYTPFGSRQTYADATAGRPDLAGTDRFFWDAMSVESLRPASFNTPPNHGLYVDSDFTVPGEWWCLGRFAGAPADRARCMAHASRESLGGTRSPFGQYYSPDPACNVRLGAVAPVSCSDTSLGSVAEEYTWSFLGARKGMFLVKGLKDAAAPLTPAGAVGANLHEVLPGIWQTEYDMVTDRIGFGTSGWHGGEGRQDDMEWLWHQGGSVQAIRTLSAGPHDLEPQNGRYSLGETDVGPQSAARDGDTWAADGQDMPGGMENHMPGSNPLYGTQLFGYVLWDKVDDGGGPSRSLYDTAQRNHPDEFLSWIWLFLASYHRCPGLADPLDDRCFTYSTAQPPNPPSIARRPLYTDPGDAGQPLAYRYLWRDPARGSANPGIDAEYIAVGDPGLGAGNCKGTAGLPWRSIWDYTGGGAGAPGTYLVEEGGYGAYSELLQGLGGLMRVIAARHPLAAPQPDLAAEYAAQRQNVLEPWYDHAYTLAKDILALYRDAAGGYGYVPDIENATCRGDDPTTPAVDDMMLSWSYGTGTPIADTVARRASWYSTLVVWYLWYDSAWLDVDPDAWLAP